MKLKLQHFGIGHTFLLVTFIAINVILTVDVTTIRISTSLGGLYPLSNYIAIFIITYVTYVASTVIILALIRKQIYELRRSSLPFNLMLLLVFTVEFTLLVLILIIIIQILTSQSYTLWLLSSVAYVSYSLGAIMLGALTFKLLSWFKRNRSLILLLYAIGISMICINSIVNILLLNVQLAAKTDVIHYQRGLSGSYGPTSSIYKSLQEFTSTFSFPFIWIATLAILNSYSNRRQSVKYWLIMAISLVYFFSQFQPFLYDLFFGMSSIDANIRGIAYTVFISAGRPIAGILFGLAFWLMSRKINNPIAKNYMLVTGFGILLIFATNQPTGLAVTPVPPFGVITTGFFGLAAYLLYVGLYSSAVSVSHDGAIRKQIRSYAKQLAFLDKIGTPEFNQQMESLVMKKVTALESEVNSLKEESGVTPSLESSEIKDYLRLVINELQEKKK